MNVAKESSDSDNPQATEVGDMSDPTPQTDGDTSSLTERSCGSDVSCEPTSADSEGVGGEAVDSYPVLKPGVIDEGRESAVCEDNTEWRQLTVAEMVCEDDISSAGVKDNISDSVDDKWESTINPNADIVFRDDDSTLGLTHTTFGSDDGELTANPNPDMVYKRDGRTSGLIHTTSGSDDEESTTNPNADMVYRREGRTSGLNDTTFGSDDEKSTIDPNDEMGSLGHKRSQEVGDIISGSDPDDTPTSDCHLDTPCESAVSDGGTPAVTTDTLVGPGARESCLGTMESTPKAEVVKLEKCSGIVLAETYQQNLHKHHHVHSHAQPTEFLSLTQNTKARLSSFDERCHVVTRATTAALRILEKSRKVMVIGGPKQGATTLVNFLAKKLSEGKNASFTPVELLSPEQWFQLPGGQYVVILDNFLGCSESSDHQWSRFLTQIQNSVDAGNVVLIMSCQNNMYEAYKARYRGQQVIDQRDMVDLSLYKIRKFEQVSVLGKIFTKLKVHVTDKELARIVENTFQERFFECCEFFMRKRKSHNLDKTFFANPWEMFQQENSQSLLDNKPLFFTLIRAALKTTGVDDDLVKYPNLSQEISHFGEYGAHVKDYIIEKNGSLIFKHDCLLLCAFLAVFQFDQHIFIRMCPLDILVNFTTAKHPDGKPSNKMKINPNLTQELSQRLQEGLAMNFELALRHDFFSDGGFLSTDPQMISVLENLDQCSVMKIATRLGHIGLLEFFLNSEDLVTMSPDSIHEFLHEAVSSLNIDIFKMLLERGVKVCEECFLYVDLLNKNTSPDALEMMLGLIGIKRMNVNVLETALEELLKHGYSEIFTRIISSLQTRCDFPDLLNVLLDLSCHFGQHNIYFNLRSNMKQFQSSQLLPHALEGGSVEIVEDLLNMAGGLNIRFSQKLSALHFAAKENNLKLFRCLLKHGGNMTEVTPNGESVLHLASTVAKTMQPITLKWLLENHRGQLSVDVVDKGRRTPLHVAATTGNVAAVRELIEAGAHVSSHDAQGNTPLHCTVMSPDPGSDIIECFIKAGADIDARNGNGETPLQQLVRTGKENDRCSILQCFISKTKERDGFDGSGRTVLQSLLYHGCNSEEAEVLVEGGCDVKAKDKRGNTVLHLLASLGNHQLVKLALEKGADVNARDDNGFTPLHSAVCVSDNDLVVGVLMKNKQSFDEVNRDGNTPLHVACSVSAVSSDKYVKRLTQIQPSLVHARNKENQTALHIATASEGVCSPANTEHLILTGADIHSTDMYGNTPLLAACFLCGPTSDQVIQTLIMYDADVNISNMDGNTPLHAACLGQGPSKENIVNILIGYRAKVLSENCHGLTPIDLVRFRCSDSLLAGTLTNAVISEACHSRQRDNQLVTLLENLKFPDKDGETVLHKVCTTSGKNTKRVISELARAGHSVDQKDSRGRTPLHVACKMSGKYSVDIVKELLVKGASVNEKDMDGNNALHFACSTSTEQSSKIVSILVAEKANLDARSNDGDTPLHKACHLSGKGIESLIWSLINGGANMDLRDYRGLRPLDMMNQGPVHSDAKCVILSAQLWKICNRGTRLHGDGIKRLLDQGASLDYKSRDGDTCLHLLCQQRGQHTLENVKLLLSLGADPHATNKSDLNPYEVALFCENMEIAEIVFKEQKSKVKKKKKKETPGFDAAEFCEVSAEMYSKSGDIVDKVEGALKDDYDYATPVLDIVRKSTAIGEQIMKKSGEVIQMFKDVSK